MADKKDSLSFLMFILTLLIIIQSGVVALLILEVLLPAKDTEAAAGEVFSFSGSTVRFGQDGGYWGFIADDGSRYLPLNLPPEVMLSEGQRVEVTAIPGDLSLIRTSVIPIRVIQLITPIAEQFSLIDTRWILETMQGNEPLQSIPAGVRITLIFRENGTFSGIAPANQYTGIYTHTGQVISFSGIEPTSRAGSHAWYDIEEQYLSSLRDTRLFEIRDEFLHLMDEHQRTLLTFRADGVFT